MVGSKALLLLALFALAACPGRFAEARRSLRQAEPSETTAAAELPTPKLGAKAGKLGKAPKPSPVPKAGAVTEPTEPAEPAEEPISLDIAAAVFNASGFDALLSGNMSAATIFTPSDKAFEKLAKSLNLTNATDLLLPEYLNTSTAIASLHIIPGVALFSANITPGVPITLPSLAGDNITIVSTGMNGVVRVYVGSANETAAMGSSPYGLAGEVPGNEAAKVIRADLPFKNTVVHVIDKVLLPPNATLPEPEPEMADETAPTTP